MTAKQARTEWASSKTIERCSAYLEGLHERIAHRFLMHDQETFWVMDGEGL
jgi:hypothetical protein